MKFLIAAAPWVALLLPAIASGETSLCEALDSPEAVVRCALSHSPEVQSAALELEAVSGDLHSASSLLPTSPVFGATGAKRTSPSTGQQDFNWSLTLSQDIDVAGQRGLRVDAADAEVSAQRARLERARRDVGSRALSAWLRAIAARDRLELAQLTTKVSMRLRQLSEARAKEQLVSAVDARLAAAEAVRLSSERFEAERENTVALEELRLLLGVTGPATVPQGAQLSVELPDIERSEATLSRLANDGPEFRAYQSEYAAAKSRLTLAYRERFPRLTLSGFIQRDGFSENVYGLGLSAPLALPWPFWPGKSGQIQRQQAMLDKAQLQVATTQREITASLGRSLNELRLREAELALFTPELVTGARTDLKNIADALQAGQLSVRDALLAQRSLLELLQAERTVRLETMNARVELFRTAALPLPGAPR